MNYTTNPQKLTCFKAYDIRGKVPDELDDDLAYKIGLAFTSEMAVKKPVAVGRDVRHSSQGLAEAVIRGLNEGGVDTLELGLCGTEMVYFASSQGHMGGGIMVTASHNPKEFNGMKLVTENARPMSADSGLPAIERRVRELDFVSSREKGHNRVHSIMAPYVDHLLGFVNPDELKPITIVADSGNGCAGPTLDVLSERLPFRFKLLHHQPDGDFPNGVPNPLLPENRSVTAQAVRESGADLGVAWDGDFDRCFLFDEKGHFIEGYYIVGLLAERMLSQYPGSKIIHDPRLTWNTIDVVTRKGGIPIQSKAGHAFMKERMRFEDALYGGEMSAHHFFRDFAYCDSGMVPWLLVTSAICNSGRTLSDMVEERMNMFPCSGEINRKVNDPDAVIERIRLHYEKEQPFIEQIDGLSMAFNSQWRFNLRKSNTEPLIRLNVESRGNRLLMEEKKDRILSLIDDNS